AKCVDHLVPDEPLAQVLIQVQEPRLLGRAIIERGWLVVWQQVAHIQAEHETLLLRRTDRFGVAILSGSDHAVAQAEQKEEMFLADDHAQCAKMGAELDTVNPWGVNTLRALWFFQAFNGWRLSNPYAPAAKKADRGSGHSTARSTTCLVAADPAAILILTI